MIKKEENTNGVIIADKDSKESIEKNSKQDKKQENEESQGEVEKKVKTKKLFILDTNVLAHDWRSVFKFEDNDIVIPFPVIQELDNLKTKSNVSYNVRNAIKFIDKYDGDLLNKNSLGEGLGNVFVLNIEDEFFLEEYKAKNRITNMDDEIIMHAHYLKEVEAKNYDSIILVTKDAGMRVKAKALGLKGSDYEHDSVQIDNLYSGKFEVEVSSDLINKLHENKGYLLADDVPFLQKNDKLKYNYNSSFILRSDDNEKHSSLACLQKDKRDEKISDTLLVIKNRKKSQKITIETLNAEQAMAYHLLTNTDLSLVTLNGIAGTGKTLLAILAGVEQAILGSKYKRITVMRPIVSLSNKDIGYLPGDEAQKIAPFMRPIYDNLQFIKTRSTPGVQQKIEKALEVGTLSIEAMAHVRGRTYNDTILIIDESQNSTPMESKTLITRMGKNSKIIMVGDVHQIDSPYLNESTNGLSHVIDKFSKFNYPYYGHIALQKGERSELSAIAAQIL